MKKSWNQCLARAKQLAEANGPGAPLLAFYADLLALQQASYESFTSNQEWSPSGSLERDLPVVRTHVAPILNAVIKRGSQPLMLEATRLLYDAAGTAIDDALLTYWRAPSDQHFFAKAAIQPYMSWLAESGIAPVDRHLTVADNRCPFCSGVPQLSMLVSTGEAEGGGRQLLCATCLTAWPFRRVVCVYCGEEDERKTGYFHTPLFDHLRVDACESCMHYLKTVDLTKLGLAVPLVDEVAGAPLDLWARDRGYEKIELNLLGL